MQCIYDIKVKCGIPSAAEQKHGREAVLLSQRKVKGKDL